MLKIICFETPLRPCHKILKNLTVKDLKISFLLLICSDKESKNMSSSVDDSVVESQFPLQKITEKDQLEKTLKFNKNQKF